jgi:membrane associated rhomboid family serine protease
VRAARRIGQGLTFGGRVPASVGALIALTALLSLAGVVGERNGLSLVRLALFSPEAVWEGEIWRLVTWVFFETDPLSLLFGGLMLYWFGKDLAHAWGERRFVLVYLGIAAAAAAATCLAALLWPALLRGGRALGPWPVVDAMVVAWALLFPDRQILVWFALPVGGRSLLYLTVGGTLLYAAFAGFAPYAPHLAAEGLMALYVRGVRPGRWLRGWRPFDRLRRKRGKFKVIHVDRDPDRDRPRWLN